MVWIKSVKTITPMGPRSTTTCNNWLRKYYLHCYLYYFYFLCCCGAWWFFMFWYTLTPPLFYLFFSLFFCCCFSYTCVAGNFCTGTATILIFFWGLLSVLRSVILACFFQHLLKQRQQFAHYCHCPGCPAKDIFHLWHEFKLLYECKLCSASGQMETMKIM